MLLLYLKLWPVHVHAGSTGVAEPLQIFLRAGRQDGAFKFSVYGVVTVKRQHRVSGRDEASCRVMISASQTFGSLWGWGGVWRPTAPPAGSSASSPQTAGTGQRPAPCFPCNAGCTCSAHPELSRTSPSPRWGQTRWWTRWQGYSSSTLVTVTIPQAS